MKHSKNIFLLAVLSLLLITIGVFLLLELQSHWLKHLIDAVIYDNYDHYLSCEELPTPDEVRAMMDAHSDLINRIEQLSPGNVMVTLNEHPQNCQGKADILIQYPSHEIHEEIRKLLGGRIFFGIPCRFQNW